MRTEILCGNNLPILREMADNSVDAIVTDPPYGLSFMGKRWDYDVPSVELWAECLRVLKPGGHLLAFAGTRTQHRMAVRIEDAGFEIRDMIAWVYGSGFPKSLDVSKAIDRMDASEEQERRRLRFTAWVRSTGTTSRQIDAATETNMGGRYTTSASQPAIMTREHLEACRHLLGDIPDWVEREADIRSVKSQNMADREVLGVQKGAMAGWDMNGGTKFVDRNITAPATEAAKQWDGWGTALKPALEPITLARKPLAERTIAANVLTWGTGGVNVDGCRNGNESGRWPANFIHDGSDEVTGLFPVTASGDLKGQPRVENKIYGSASKTLGKPRYWNGDTSSASRFFYCAKASRSEREAGLEGVEARLARCMNMRNDNHAQQNGLTYAPKSNHHPTVKPIALMRYLCRLVTPPGGIVLDPFTGSGTTGCAATLEGFGFVGIEREAEYAEIARRRIEHWREVANQDEGIIKDVQEKLFAGIG